MSASTVAGVVHGCVVAFWLLVWVFLVTLLHVGGLVYAPHPVAAATRGAPPRRVALTETLAAWAVAGLVLLGGCGGVVVRTLVAAVVVLALARRVACGAADPGEHRAIVGTAGLLSLALLGSAVLLSRC